MNIPVKQVTTVSKYSYMDNTFYCEHENIEVEKPCCNGNNCDCYGLDSVYCEDCDNADLTEEQANEYSLNALIGDN